MDGSFNNDIISTTRGRICAKALKETAYKYAFCSDGIIRMELSASTIYNGLLEKFTGAAIKYDTEEISTAAEEKLMRIVSDNYKTVYKIFSQGKSESEKLYMRLLLVTDFICGMTDSYARDLYRQINGI